MASTVQGATLFSGDAPDIRLGVGQAGNNVFDLQDFFDSTGSTAVVYSVDSGGSLAGSVASVFGSQTAGKKTVKFTATSGSETLDLTSGIYVTTKLIGNGPAIDDNNRLAGQNAGNMFLNALTPGETVNSKVALTLPPVSATGSGTTGGGVTGAAGLIVTIASLDLVEAGGNTGMWKRAVTVDAQGTNSATVANELTATLNADGTYSVQALPGLDGDYVVSFGVKSGDVADAVHLVAAEASPVNVATGAMLQLNAGTFTAATVAFSANTITVTAGPNQGALLVASAATTVGNQAVTIQADVTTTSASTVTAIIGFDVTSVADPNLGSQISYSNPSGANVVANTAKTLATTVRSISGSVIPAIQVVNPGTTAATITITNFEVVMAGPLTEYAINPNAKEDLKGVDGSAVEGSIAGLGGWLSNIVPSVNAAAPTLDTANNHFTATASQGSLKLSGTTAASKVANAFTTATISSGTVVGECYVKRVGAAPAGSVFYFVITDGASEFATFKSGGSIPENDWALVQNSATLTSPTTGYVVVQAANLDVLVDDVAVRTIEDESALFDASLLGL